VSLCVYEELEMDQNFREGEGKPLFLTCSIQTYAVVPGPIAITSLEVGLAPARRKFHLSSSDQ
jgi:hypothetical protein